MLSELLDIIFARSPDANVWLAMLLTLLGFALMYISFAGVTWVALRVFASDNMITDRPLQPRQIRDEMRASLLSILMFALLAGVTFSLLRAGWLEVTGGVSVLRWTLEVFALFLWNELHFYLCHRLLHHKSLFRRIHLEHHRSHVVTPFAVYRFHWVEALLLGSVMPLAMLFHTFSVWSLIALPPLSLFWNIVGHSNWQASRPGLRWLTNASQRHAQHHARFHGNFGFSLPYLDRWFATTVNDWKIYP